MLVSGEYTGLIFNKPHPTAWNIPDGYHIEQEYHIFPTHFYSQEYLAAKKKEPMLADYVSTLVDMSIAPNAVAIGDKFIYLVDTTKVTGKENTGILLVLDSFALLQLLYGEDTEGNEVPLDDLFKKVSSMEWREIQKRLLNPVSSDLSSIIVNNCAYVIDYFDKYYQGYKAVLPEEPTQEIMKEGN